MLTLGGRQMLYSHRRLPGYSRISIHGVSNARFDPNSRPW